MHRGTTAALLACCLLTAGCAGLSPAAGDAGSGTVTPAPVPEAPPAPLAPGLTATGVSDINALARAHVSALSNTSYTVAHRRQVAGPNGTLREQRTTRAEVAAAYTAYRAVREVEGTAVTDRTLRSRWVDGRAIETVTQGTTTERRIVADSQGIGGPPLPPRAALFFEPTLQDRLRTLLSAIDIVAVEPGSEEVSQLYGTPVLRIRADGAEDPAALAGEGGGTVSDVTATATVTRNGLVRSLALQYTLRRNGTAQRVTESLRITDLGTTRVPES